MRRSFSPALAPSLLAPLPPPNRFTFSFSSRRDAYDAVRGRDGYDFYGARLRVELSRGGARAERPPPGAFGPGPGGPPSRRGPRPGSGFRILVRGLPISASWQDLKDHFRRVATPSFADVVRDRGEPLGIIEYERREDAERAVRELDDAEFKNPFDRSYLRLFEEGWGGPRDYDQPRGRGDYRDEPYGRGPPPRDQGRRGGGYPRDDDAPKGRGEGRERSPPRGDREPARGRGRERDRSRDRSRSRSPYDGREGAREPDARDVAGSPARSASPMDAARDGDAGADASPRERRDDRAEEQRGRSRSRSRTRSPAGSPDRRSPPRDDASRSPPRRDD